MKNPAHCTSEFDGTLIEPGTWPSAKLVEDRASMTNCSRDVFANSVGGTALTEGRFRSYTELTLSDTGQLQHLDACSVQDCEFDVVAGGTEIGLT